MSLVRGVYLGLVNVVTGALLQPWSTTLLGTAAAFATTNLVVYHLLSDRPSKRTSLVTGCVLISSGVTLLCSRSARPSTIMEAFPYALVYLAGISIPYGCYLSYKNRRRPRPPTPPLTSVVVEKVVPEEKVLTVSVQPSVNITPSPVVSITPPPVRSITPPPVRSITPPPVRSITPSVEAQNVAPASPTNTTPPPLAEEDYEYLLDEGDSLLP